MALTPLTDQNGVEITDYLLQPIELKSLLFDLQNHLGISISAYNHIYDLQNHLNENITDENGGDINVLQPLSIIQINVIQLHTPGINNIIINGDINSYFAIENILIRSRYLNKKINIYYDFSQKITLEIYPTTSIDIILTLLSGLAKHKIIGSATINIGTNIVNQLIKYVMNATDINITAIFNSDYIRERNGTSLFDIINIIESKITRAKILDADVDINTIIDNEIAKLIDWYETIIFRFNNYKFEILTNDIGVALTNHLKEKLIIKTYKEN